MRSETTRSILFLTAGMIVALILLLSSCNVIRRAERSANPEIRETLESWYITKENPENNYPGEVDSIRRELRNQLKNRR